LTREGQILLKKNQKEKEGKKKGGKFGAKKETKVNLVKPSTCDPTQFRIEIHKDQQQEKGISAVP